MYTIIIKKGQKFFFDVCFQLSLEICNLFQTDLHYIESKKKKNLKTKQNKTKYNKKGKKYRDYSGLPFHR